MIVINLDKVRGVIRGNYVCKVELTQMNIHTQDLRLSSGAQVWTDAQAAAGAGRAPLRMTIARCGTMPPAEASAWAAAVDDLYQLQMDCQQPQQLSVASVTAEPLIRWDRRLSKSVKYWDTGESRA